MDTRIKVVTEQIHQKKEELMGLFNILKSELLNMTGSLLIIDDFIELKGVLKVKSKANDFKALIEEQMSDLEKHLENLMLIAEAYERNERMNVDVANKLN